MEETNYEWKSMYCTEKYVFPFLHYWGWKGEKDAFSRRNKTIVGIFYDSMIQQIILKLSKNSSLFDDPENI